MTEGAGRRGLRGLYAVTPDEADTARLAALVDRVLQGRPALLQYRNKRASTALRREQADVLLTLCRAAGVPLLINDDLELALAVGADGVHLGRDDGDPAAAREVLGPRRLLGVTCYSEFERAARGAAAGADYVAFGAMFASSSKPGAPRAPLELLGRARRELGVPVAAIGGITRENAFEVIAAGADLVAVINDIFGAADPAAQAASYRPLFGRAAAPQAS